MKKRLVGEIVAAPDKSISHRSVMLGSIARGTTHIKNFLTGEDCMSTIHCFRQLGVRITLLGSDVTVYADGSLREAKEPLYTGNSGTTTRLLTGLLAGYPIHSVLSGDQSLNERPMKRVITPLTQMGATIKARDNDFCPLEIWGKKQLHAISYLLPVASAQLKSAILLAALHADGKTRIQETNPSRDHTENLLRTMGATVISKGNLITISPKEDLSPLEISVPGDFSSAAFFIVAALITPNSELFIQNVGMNPTRTGLLRVLRQMGGTIEEINRRIECGEEVADLYVTHAKLRGVSVPEDLIPSLIDEIPILAVAAACAEGTTSITGARELRVKETDRIHAISAMLKTAGVSYEEKEDGILIQGTDHIRGGVYESFGDHRMAMSETILSLVSKEEFKITDKTCVNISFPTFWDTLSAVLTK